MDPATERWIRDLLRGRDGEIALRFRVSGRSVTMHVLPEGGSGRHAQSASQTPDFDEWLGDVLKERRMSQEAAARAVGVSLKTVNRWVNGRTEPRMRELRRIQKAFGLVPPL